MSCCLAFLFACALPTVQMPQPRIAFRLLMMDMAGGYWPIFGSGGGGSGGSAGGGGSTGGGGTGGSSTGSGGGGGIVTAGGLGIGSWLTTCWAVSATVGAGCGAAADCTAGPGAGGAAPLVGESDSLFAGAGATVGAAWPPSRFPFVDARGATALCVSVVLAAFLA